MSIGEDLEARFMGEPRPTMYPQQPHLQAEAAMADVEIETDADLIMLLPDAADAVSAEEDTAEAADQVLAAWRAYYALKPDDQHDSEDVSEASTQKSDQGSGKGSSGLKSKGPKSQKNPVPESQSAPVSFEAAQPVVQGTSQAQSNIMHDDNLKSTDGHQHQPEKLQPSMNAESSAVAGLLQENIAFTDNQSLLKDADTGFKQSVPKREISPVKEQADVLPPRPDLSIDAGRAQSDQLMQNENTLSGLVELPEQPRVGFDGNTRHAQSELIGPDTAPPIPLSISSAQDTLLPVQSNAEKEPAPAKPLMGSDLATAQADDMMETEPEHPLPEAPQRPEMDKSNVHSQDDIV